jgi:hypothetical protein
VQSAEGYGCMDDGGLVVGCLQQVMGPEGADVEGAGELGDGMLAEE